MPLRCFRTLQQVRCCTICAALFVFSGDLHSQNLVPNPSFEDFSACPAGIQTHLTEPLVAGTTYDVSLWYSLADNYSCPGWDGTFRDSPMNPGVYVYLVEWTDAENITVRHKEYGDITILK